MGKFFVSYIWLEDREIEILENFNFKEEVWESEIPEDKKHILYDLEKKGFLHSVVFEGKKYYQHSGGYLQHFDN
jgi:hypothetical protein